MQTSPGLHRKAGFFYWQKQLLPLLIDIPQNTEIEAEPLQLYEFGSPMKFSIETVSKMTGIPAPSLRNWEKRYGFPCPERSAGGHRFYTARDVEFLKKAVLWIEEGQSLQEIAKAYQDQGNATTAPRVQKAPSEFVDDVTYRVELIYEALLKFDSMATLQHYATLSAKLSVEQLFDRVFEKILRRVGEDWSRGLITIAQEHYASSFVRLKLSTFLCLDFPPTQTPRILATTMSGERHEGGLMLVIAHLKFLGYPVYYLGSDLPPEELAGLVQELKPDVVCLTYSSPENLLRDLSVLKQLKVPICIGGSAAFQDLALNSSETRVFLCQKTVSSEAAQYVEMICQSKVSRK